MTSIAPTNFVFECFVPVVTESESNASDVEHWSRKHKRHKAQKEIVAWTLQAAFAKLAVPMAMRKSSYRRPPSPYVKIPQAISDGALVVYLIRHGPRKLDSDNIEGALKHVRDAVAIAIGRDDGHKDGIEWREKEQRTDAHKIGVLIRIEPVTLIETDRTRRILRLLESHTKRDLLSMLLAQYERMGSEELATVLDDLIRRSMEKSP